MLLQKSVLALALVAAFNPRTLVHCRSPEAQRNEEEITAAHSTILERSCDEFHVTVSGNYLYQDLYLDQHDTAISAHICAQNNKSIGSTDGRSVDGKVIVTTDYNNGAVTLFHSHCMHVDEHGGLHIGVEIESSKQGDETTSSGSNRDLKNGKKSKKESKKGLYNCPFTRHLEQGSFSPAGSKVTSGNDPAGALWIMYLKPKAKEDPESKDSIAFDLNAEFDTSCTNFVEAVEQEMQKARVQPSVEFTKGGIDFNKQEMM